MKKFLLATAAIASVTVAVPASAQVGHVLRDGLASILGNSSANLNLGARLNDLNLRVQTSYQRGEISRTEATRLQAEISDLARREQAYRSDGLTRNESNDL